MNFRIVRDDVLNHFREKERSWSERAKLYRDTALSNEQTALRYAQEPPVAAVCRQRAAEAQGLALNCVRRAAEWAYLILHLDDADPVILSSEELRDFEFVAMPISGASVGTTRSPAVCASSA